MDGTNSRRILLRVSTSQYIPFSKQGGKDTPVKNDASIDEKKQEQETPKSLLEKLIREGARRLFQAAIEQEMTEYLERFREEKDDKGNRMVVRNGRLPERMFVTGVGPLRIPQPRIRDKREGETFSSAILPPLPAPCPHQHQECFQTIDDHIEVICRCIWFDFANEGSPPGLLFHIISKVISDRRSFAYFRSR